MGENLPFCILITIGYGEQFSLLGYRRQVTRLADYVHSQE
jgi:hypothetical protein